ncbi:GNAT family N-acetyltransferase [Bacillus sp. 31A1R]|uniref:GNAT family N-acetyltransferase n=1 Tax=Robertmurraya mangrovi TaxID=3098077 RepID=A0ABU5IW90_9BACI|nr:GNAT family N-acetyltransferase [Bacillus sp. 31A1R]MDZ5471376.1 GNAT family N-acetyltransferase [Bacillus sp. 31A1R]
MQIVIAQSNLTRQVESFFKDNMDISNSGIYSQEFLCPLGIRASVRRKQMMVAMKDNAIIGAVRFYEKKTTKNISLYQFAIQKSYRGTGLLKEMLKQINQMPIHAKCPVESDFNQFYRKNGWVLLEEGEVLNEWVLCNS